MAVELQGDCALVRNAIVALINYNVAPIDTHIVAVQAELIDGKTELALRNLEHSGVIERRNGAVVRCESRRLEGATWQ